jgi:hypothetical protein
MHADEYDTTAPTCDAADESEFSEDDFTERGGEVVIGIGVEVNEDEVDDSTHSTKDNMDSVVSVEDDLSPTE